MALRRVVVVGLGSIGRRHARLLSKREDVQVELFDPNTEAIALARGESGEITVHSSFDEMLDSRPHCVLIATPHSLHASQTIKALQSGAHVLCEKPMSDTLTDALMMTAAASSASVVLSIGFPLHFDPRMRMLREVIDRGELGSVLHAHALVGTYVTLVNSASRYQASQTGALLMDYAHQPDILYWLLGEKPKRVHACALKAGDMEFSSNPNIALINCEYEISLLSSIHLNYLQMPERHEYEIIGDKGWARLDMNEATLKIGLRKDSSVTTEVLKVERDEIIRAEHQAFFDAADGKRRPETSAEDGLVSVAVVEAAMKSWQAGCGVEVSMQLEADAHD